MALLMYPGVPGYLFSRFDRWLAVRKTSASYLYLPILDRR